MRNIAAERVRLGLTQEQLGLRIGVHTGTIARWENESDPNIGSQHLKSMARLFGTTTDYLLEYDKKAVGA